MFYRSQITTTTHSRQTPPKPHHLDVSLHPPPKPRQIATSPHHPKDRSRGSWWQEQGLETRHVSSPWYIFFLLFITKTNSCLHLQVGLVLPPSEKTTTTISGPNDIYHVVWALGEFFLIIICCFWLLTTIFLRFLNVLQQWVLGHGTHPCLEPRYYPTDDDDESGERYNNHPTHLITLGLEMLLLLRP